MNNLFALKQIMLWLTLCVISTNTHANTDTSEQDVVGVQELMVLGIGCHLKDDTCYITVDRPVGIYGECLNNSVRWFKNEQTGSEILSMFLAATMAKRKVGIYIKPDQCFGTEGKYPTFGYMGIRAE